MQTNIQDQLSAFTDSVIAYLPNLLGGIILILLGWLVGWICKRFVTQISIMLRMDRIIRQTPLKVDLSKADVRYGISNFIGNIVYVIVFIIFLDNALLAWKLNVLSDLLNRGILFLPKIIIAVVIFSLGWLLATWVQYSVLRALHRERVMRASLISKLVKGVLLLFFSAIAFLQLDISREIVIIGFTTVFVTLSVIMIIITSIGAKNFVQKIEE